MVSKDKLNLVLPEGHRWEDESCWDNDYDFRWECKDCKADYFIAIDEQGEITKVNLKKYHRPLCTDQKDEAEVAEATVDTITADKDEDDGAMYCG